MKVFLERVTMENCQSMEDVTFDFVHGINIIAGDNSYGKSIFMKILRLTVFPEEYSRTARNDIIRYGKDFATVHYYFSDNMDCIVKIYRNKSIYMLRDPLITRDYLVSETPFGRMKTALAIIADDQEKFLVNVFNAGQELFLVKSDSRTNERLIRASCYNEELDELKQLVTQKESFYRNEYSELENIRNKYIIDMGDRQYKDTTELERLLELSNTLIPILTGLVDLDELYGSLIPHEDIGGLSINACLALVSAYEVYNLLENIQEVDEVSERVLEASYTILPVLDSIEKLLFVDNAQESVLISLGSCLSVMEDINNLNDDNYTLVDCVYKLFEVVWLIDDVTEEVDYELPLSLVDLRTSLMQLNNLLEDYASTLEVWGKANSESSKLDREMKQFNGLVPCQIYGEVFFVDGKCIPADNGPA